MERLVARDGTKGLRAAVLLAAAVSVCTALLFAPPESATSAPFERNCKAGTIRNGGYQVTRLRTWYMTCREARRVLSRYIGTARVPTGWRLYRPGRPFTNGLTRVRGLKGSFAYAGYYIEDPYRY